MKSDSCAVAVATLGGGGGDWEGEWKKDDELFGVSKRCDGVTGEG